VRLVFKQNDITKLTKKAYKHITLHMGFIAHYSLYGFQDVYQDVDKFAQRLLTSELSNDAGRNKKIATRYMDDPWFVREYGKAYCQSVSDTNVGIIEIVENFLKK
jgi:hypothetical protein